ncbi:MAG: carboxylating nicotinate-nucleotide diphosphorylase [Ignavibacteriales bacterium]|nr:carboxylating nicotinate-nucleotide diphosphorylase [Ignavibacteriales bacterium]
MSLELADEGSLYRIVETALREDIGAGDLTSESCIAAGAKGEAFFLAKEDGVFSGSEILRLTFRTVDPSLVLNQLIFDGDLCTAGETISTLSGSMRGILAGERVALNFIQRMSGIATLTRKYVDAVEGTEAKIIDTRKTAPGLRALDKRAVRDGGGANHRFGLDSMVLIKDNHIAAAGGITLAISECKQYLKQRGLKPKIEVETTSLAEVEEVLACGGIDRIMLDNYDLPSMKTAVKRIAHEVEVEASGGITLATVRSVAETGVDFISIGALTHSPRALDISLEIRQ